jgi:hypothetical protein
MLDTDLRSKLRLNGHTTDTRRHADGGAQGSVSSGPRFNVIQEALMIDAESFCDGFRISKHDSLHSFGYADDGYKFFGINAKNLAQKWMSHRVSLAAKWMCQYKLPKDQMLVRGFLADSVFTWIRHDGSPLCNSKSIEALGHILTQKIGHSPVQQSRTLARMQSKTRALHWLLSVDSLAVPTVASSLFSSLVLSVATSKLPLIRLSSAKFAKFENVQAEFAASILSLPSSTPF